MRNSNTKRYKSGNPALLSAHFAARKIWPKTANLFTKSRATDRAAKLLTRNEARRIAAN
jgi:hypothetical protein